MFVVADFDQRKKARNSLCTFDARFIRTAFPNDVCMVITNRLVEKCRQEAHLWVTDHDGTCPLRACHHFAGLFQRVLMQIFETIDCRIVGLVGVVVLGLPITTTHHSSKELLPNSTTDFGDGKENQFVTFNDDWRRIPSGMLRVVIVNVITWLDEVLHNAFGTRGDWEIYPGFLRRIRRCRSTWLLSNRRNLSSTVESAARIFERRFTCTVRHFHLFQPKCRLKIDPEHHQNKENCQPRTYTSTGTTSPILSP
mmetsp:Transcript_5895/g.11554  ORF Transcript_5895/g.11554 Transcript_5895/m.11554 type:complete len:253 (-) Transcript_5895:108-866(-)